MQRVRARLGRVPVPLALMLLVSFLLGSAWSLATAPLQGPDETEHVAYTARLAEHGEIPEVTSGDRPAGDDQAYALGPLGFARVVQNRQARPPWSALAEAEFQRLEDELPEGAPGAGAGPNPLAKNPPLAYVYNAAGWRLTPGGGYFDRLFVMRLLSTFAFVAMVLFTWLAAGEVFRRRRLPQTVATGVAALLPMGGFIGGIVTTDIQLAAVWAAFTWLALRTVRSGPSVGASAGLSALAVASVLIHGRGLAILPALVAVLGVAWLRHRPDRRTTLRAGAATAGTLAGGLVAFRLATASAGAGGSLYGGEATLGVEGGAAFSVRQFLSFVWQFYLPRLDSMAPRPGAPTGFRQIVVQQYLGGVFSNFEVYFPFWVYDVIQISFVVLLIVLWTLAAARWSSVRRRWPTIAVLGAIAASLMAFLHLASYRAVYQGGDNPLIVGRYLLPMTAVLGIAVGAAVCAAGRRTQAVAAGVVLGAMCFLSLAALGLNVERFYV